jgi:hypothetical protein
MNTAKLRKIKSKCFELLTEPGHPPHAIAAYRSTVAAIDGLLRISTDPDEQGMASAYGTPTSDVTLTAILSHWEALI